MRALAFLVPMLAALPVCAEKWTAYRSEPFTVISNGSEKDARETLAGAIQVQYTLSTLLGRELQPVWPVVLVQKKGEAAVDPLRLHRESYMARIPVAPGLRSQLIENLVLLLLREGTSRMDVDVEQGLAAAYSTLEVDGPRVTLGAPVQDRNVAWARMHLLLTDPRYSGKTRVLLSNLAKGVDDDAAWKNAFGVPRKELDTEVKQYLQAGKFPTVGLNGKAIDPRRFREEELAPWEVALFEADFSGEPDAYRAVLKLKPDAQAAREGLALALIEHGQAGEAAQWLEGAKGARALAAANTRDSLELAWRANLRWSKPHEQLAAIETLWSNKAQRFKKAAELAPREVRLWRAAAEAFEKAELHAEAARMWLMAERSASSAEDRAALRATRLAAISAKAEADDAERRRIEEEKRAELERLHQQMLDSIHAAEAKANGGKGPVGAAVEWWDGPKPDAQVRAKLERVDCLRGGVLRLTLRDGGSRPLQVLVRDRSKIVVREAESAALGCGLQRPSKMVQIEYFAKPDRGLQSAGDVATLLFEPAQ